MDGANLFTSGFSMNFRPGTEADVIFLVEIQTRSGVALSPRPAYSPSVQEAKMGPLGPKSYR